MGQACSSGGGGGFCRNKYGSTKYENKFQEKSKKKRNERQIKSHMNFFPKNFEEKIHQVPLLQVPTDFTIIDDKGEQINIQGLCTPTTKRKGGGGAALYFYPSPSQLSDCEQSTLNEGARFFTNTEQIDDNNLRITSDLKTDVGGYDYTQTLTPHEEFGIVSESEYDQVIQALDDSMFEARSYEYLQPVNIRDLQACEDLIVRHAHRLEALRIKLKERMVRKDNILQCGVVGGSRRMLSMPYVEGVTQVIVEISHIEIGKMLREGSQSTGKQYAFRIDIPEECALQRGAQTFRSEPFTLMSLENKRLTFVLLFKQRGNFTLQLLECELKATDHSHMARSYKDIGSKYTFQTDQLQEGNLLTKEDLHIYPEALAKNRPEMLLFQRSIVSSSSFALDCELRQSRIDNPLYQEVDDIKNMQFRTEQAVEDNDDGRVSIVSCDTRDFQFLHEQSTLKKNQKKEKTGGFLKMISPFKSKPIKKPITHNCTSHLCKLTLRAQLCRDETSYLSSLIDFASDKLIDSSKTRDLVTLMIQESLVMQGDIMASMSPESAGGDENKPNCLFKFVTSSSPTPQKKKRHQLSLRARDATPKVKQVSAPMIMDEKVETRLSLTSFKEERPLPALEKCIVTEERVENYTDKDEKLLEAVNISRNAKSPEVIKKKQAKRVIKSVSPKKLKKATMLVDKENSESPSPLKQVSPTKMNNLKLIQCERENHTNKAFDFNSPDVKPLRKQRKFGDDNTAAQVGFNHLDPIVSA